MISTASDPRVTSERVPGHSDPEPYGTAAVGAALTQALECAAGALSIGDVAPWRFTVRGESLELRLVDQSETPVLRECGIDCGAALENIKVAMRRWGYTARVTILPDESSPELLARITVGSPHVPSRLDILLFGAAMKRHPTSGRYCAAPIPPRLVAAIGFAAELEGAWLKQMTDDLRRAVVASLVTGSDRLAMSADSFLAAIVTQGDTLREWIIAGQALQLVTLVSNTHGVSVSVVKEPIRAPAFRARLRPLIGPSGSPQVVVHLGYLAPPPVD